jgi:hypothetical protein
MRMKFHDRSCSLCCCSKSLKSQGEWGLPKFRAALLTADSNRDDAVLMSEVLDAVTSCKLTLTVPLLESYFRSLRPRVGSVPVHELLAPFQVHVSRPVGIDTLHCMSLSLALIPPSVAALPQLPIEFLNMLFSALV